MGFSFGGWVALEYAITYPEHPGSLILCNTEAYVDVETRARAYHAKVLRLGLGETKANEIANIVRKLGSGKIDSTKTATIYLENCAPFFSEKQPNHTEEAIWLLCKQNPLAWEVFDREEQFKFNHSSRLVEIIVPVLSISGELDVEHPASCASKMCQMMINAKMVRQVILKGAGDPVYQDDPEGTIKAIRKFIFELYPQSPALGTKAAKFKASQQQTSSNPLTNSNTVMDIEAMRDSADTMFTELLDAQTIPKGIDITEKLIKIEEHLIKFRMYCSRNIDTNQPASVIIFHPGGGLALDMHRFHDVSCAIMCREANSIIISIQPLLTPEYKYPIVLKTAYAATKYCFQNTQQFGIDGDKFIVSGYSMGGNLAAQIVNKSRTDPDLTITGQILISAQTDMSLSTRHNPEFNSGADLDFMAPISMQELFINLCLPEGTKESDLQNPAFSPFFDDLSDLPPTILIAGECDALAPDMRAMEKKLEAVKVDVKTFIIPGQIHNTLLLYHILGDGPHPATIAGKQAQHLY